MLNYVIHKLIDNNANYININIDNTLEASFMKHKGIIATAILFTSLTLSSCAEQISYKVTEKEYQMFYDSTYFFSNINSLNFTVTATEIYKGKTYTYVAKVDNGKIYSNVGDEFYVDIKPNSYKPISDELDYDLYYIDEGVWVKESFKNYEFPEIANFPYLGFAPFNELEFDEETNQYRLENNKSVDEIYYEFRNFSAKFENGKLVLEKYEFVHKSASSLNEIEYRTYEVKDYGKTKVTLPNVS